MPHKKFSRSFVKKMIDFLVNVLYNTLMRKKVDIVSPLL